MEEADFISQLLQQNKLLMDMISEMKSDISELKLQLKPVNKFFTNIQKKPTPIMSKAEKEALDDEAMQAAITAKALKRLSKKGLL